MSPHDTPTTDETTTESPPSGDASRPVRRRRFLALGLGAGTMLLAGCSGDGGGDDGATSDSPTDTAATGSDDAGTFRLLISDQPNAIGDFDSLNVSFDRARVFRSGEDGDGTATPAGADDEAAEVETETQTSDSTATAANETSDPTPTSVTETPDGDDADEDDSDDEENGAEADRDEDEADGDAGGFTTMDLGGVTVDLTEVVGSKARNIFESGLPAGRYTKIELHAAEIEGVVDGEPADVKLPSGKLMLTKPFEVAAGSTVSFVFDISVVKKGNGGYNLLPVVSESGVAGEDVEVEEVDDDDSEEGETDEAESDDAETDDVETDDAETDDAGPNDADGDGTPTETN